MLDLDYVNYLRHTLETAIKHVAKGQGNLSINSDLINTDKLRVEGSFGKTKITAVMQTKDDMVTGVAFNVRFDLLGQARDHMSKVNIVEIKTQRVGLAHYFAEAIRATMRA